jgi:hypothetical protein
MNKGRETLRQFKKDTEQLSKGSSIFCNIRNEDEVIVYLHT